MVAFSSRQDFAICIAVNRHFLENEYGDIIFFCCFELSNKDLYGINKVLLPLDEHGDPSILLQNLISYNINNQ